jgi:hypothetical protein
MQTIELNKKVASIEVADDKIIINLEQKYIPKEGEYFYVETKEGSKFIGIKKKGDNITRRYCSCDAEYSMYSEIYVNEGRICDYDKIKEIRPATKEEVDLFDKTLQRHNRKWNPETMQIEDLPKVGDFCIFWDNDKSEARCGILVEIYTTLNYPYSINYDVYFKNCIPFKSVDHFKKFINET